MSKKSESLKSGAAILAESQKRLDELLHEIAKAQLNFGTPKFTVESLAEGWEAYEPASAPPPPKCTCGASIALWHANESTHSHWCDSKTSVSLFLDIDTSFLEPQSTIKREKWI